MFIDGISRVLIVLDYFACILDTKSPLVLRIKYPDLKTRLCALSFRFWHFVEVVSCRV